MAYLLDGQELHRQHRRTESITQQEGIDGRHLFCKTRCAFARQLAHLYLPHQISCESKAIVLTENAELGIAWQPA